MNMKHLSLILVCMLTLQNAPMAQNVYEIPNLAAKDAIVRCVNNKLTLLYRESKTGQNSFVIYDGSTNVAVHHLPVGLSVRDIVIYNETAYFCGDQGGSGVVGYFDVIQAHASGTATIEYAVTAPILPSPSNTLSLDAKTFSRLDVFTVGSQVYFAAVGETIIDYYHYPSTTILCAHHPAGTPTWYFYYYYNKDAFIRYTDIAVLDNVIAAVGTDSTGTGCYVNTFLKTVNFPANVLITDIVQKIDIGTPLTGEPLATALPGNRMAVAQFSQNSVSTFLHRLQVSAAGAVTAYDYTSLTPSSALPHSGHPWSLLDLAYNAPYDSIYLLQHANLPGYAGFDYWMFTFPVNVVLHSVSGTLLHEGNEQSLDLNLLNRPVTAGISPYSNLNFYIFVLPGTRYCWETIPFAVNDKTPTISYVDVDDKTIPDNPTNNTFVSEKMLMETLLECKQESKDTIWKK